MINYIKIYGLHGDKDVLLSFQGSVKIIIGDNGSGKTTVLNALYSILSQDFYKLNKINFVKIELEFSSGDLVEIEKNILDFVPNMDFKNYPYIEMVKGVLEDYELFDLMNVINNSSYNKVQMLPNFRRIYRNYNGPSRHLFEQLKDVSSEFLNDYKNGMVSDTVRQIVSKNVFGHILYLPTYRRVEEALNNLGYYDDFIPQDQLIQFGMNDVKSRFSSLKNELKETAVKLYTNLNGKMLTQLASNYKASETEFSKIEKTEELRIVLSRVGDGISNETKSQIMELIESGSIKEDRFHPLVFILSNLVDVYLEQKETDDSIKLFVKVANRYLVNKEFIYDENNVDIKILNKKSKSTVELENLSSGEKQLISIFSMLYLDKIDDYIIIFDEPELSLSIEWQETLLPDMLDSKKCQFLVAATHSPFIFDNYLDDKTGIIEIVREG